MSSPRPPGASQSALCALSFPLEPGELVAQTSPRPPRSALLTAPKHQSRGCAVKAPGELGLRCRLGSYPSCSARAELGPTDSPPRRARSPLPFSPLVSSTFCAPWGGERRRGECFPAPTSRRGESGVGARRRKPLRPFAPALRICPCSRRSCCRRLGCLGGRLRVT